MDKRFCEESKEKMLKNTEEERKMLRKSRLFAPLFVFAMAFIAFAMTVYAGQNGLEAEILSDKPSYSAGENIGITIRLQNTNDFAVENVKVSAVIPNGLTLKSGKTSMEYEQLNALGIYEYSFTLQKSQTAGNEGTETGNDRDRETGNGPISTDSTGQTGAILINPDSNPLETTEINNTQENNNGDLSDNLLTESEQPAQGTPETGDLSDNRENPKTYDTANNNTLLSFILFGIMAILAVVFGIFTYKSRKTAKKIISVILCVAFLGSAITGFRVYKAKAEESGAVTGAFEVSKEIVVGGKSYTISAKVEYGAASDGGDIDLVIDQGDSMTVTKVNFQLTGSFNPAFNVVSIEYLIAPEMNNFEINYDEPLDTGKASINGNKWVMNDIKPYPDRNIITVVAKTKDGKTYEKKIEVFFDMGSIYTPNENHVKYDEKEKLQYVNNIVIIDFENNVSEQKKLEIINSINGKIVGRFDNSYDVEILPCSLDELILLCEELEKGYPNEIIMVYFDLVWDIDTLLDFIPNDTWKNEHEKFSIDNWYDNLTNSYDTNYGVRAIEASAAWNYYNTDPVRIKPISVGIVDDGFDLGHDDLVGKINISIFHQTLQGQDNYPMPHGTHVAGIVGATGNNKTGIAGIAYMSPLIGINLGSNNADLLLIGTTNKRILSSLKYAVYSRCKVVNYSLGLSGQLSSNDKEFRDWVINYHGKAFSAKMAELRDEGYDFIVVQSAGNGDKNEEAVDVINNLFFSAITYSNIPNKYKDKADDILNRIIIVGNAELNTNKPGTFQQSASSNYGDKVDICAPGTGIFSTVPQYVSNGNTIKYEYKSGTSMAAPYVAGVCALVWGVDPTWSGDKVRNIVLWSVQEEDNVIPNVFGQTTLPMLNARLAVEAAIRLKYDEAEVRKVYGNITGHVVNGEGEFLQNIRVTVRGFKNISYGEDMTTYEGWFWHNVPEGRYTLEFAPPLGYEIISVTPLDYIEITPGKTVDLGQIIIELAPIGIDSEYGGIWGTVIDETGTPLEDIRVSAYNDSNALVAEATTINGYYSFFLPEGRYKLQFSPPSGFEIVDISVPFDYVDVIAETTVEPEPVIITLAPADEGDTNYDFIIPVTHQKTVPAGYTGIYTAQDLDNVRNNLSGNYIMMNNIDLSSWGEWTPIGENVVPYTGIFFTGIFDGNGYVIKNLTITSGRYEHVGIFGFIDGATVKNVGLEGTNIIISTGWVGGICGTSYGASSINNCYNNGNISTSANYSYAGGICGSSYSPISNCYNNGNIIGDENYGPVSASMGGICGRSFSLISNCYNNGSISAYAGSTNSNLSASAG